MTIPFDYPIKSTEKVFIEEHLINYYGHTRNLLDLSIEVIFWEGMGAKFSNF